MINIFKSVDVSNANGTNGVKKYIEGACISDDVSSLPTENIATGSNILVVDSKVIKVFEEEQEEWVDWE